MATLVQKLTYLVKRPLLVCGLLVLQSPLALAADMWTPLFEEYLQDAASGDADAQYEVGVMYLKGQGVAANRQEAIKWLKSAQAQGHEQADTKLQRMQDNENRFEQLRKRAESGDAKQQYEIAQMYIRGKGTAIDFVAARNWLEKAASQGHVKAMTRLGILHYKGEDGKLDYAKALKLFTAAQSESVLAQYYLGEMYASGNGVDKDYTKAISWYEKSANGGFHRAHGKVINLQEEVKMQKRRQARVTDKKQRADSEMAAKPASTAKLAKAHQKPVKKTPERKMTVAVRKNKIKNGKMVDKLAGWEWLREDKPVDFLPSSVNECDLEKGKLVCFSEVLERNDGHQTVQYRVKSIIRENGDRFTITYRNLVLDVAGDQQSDSEEEVLGYDDEAEKGFKIKTGWTKGHSVDCRFKAKGKLNCVKDKAHKMTIVAGNKSSKSGVLASQ